MRWLIGLSAPVALMGVGCSSWYRAGPQARVVDQKAALEAKGTIEGGLGPLMVPLALSGGATLDEGEATASLESGIDLYPAEGALSYVIGPRFVGMLAGPTGTQMGLGGGPVLALDGDSNDTTTLGLELFAGTGLSGDVQGDFAGSVCLTIGVWHQDRFRVPSGRVLRVGSAAMRTRAASRSAWSAAVSLRDCPLEERRWQARRWLNDALDEHASIFAFVRLALELRTLGAPAQLVSRCQQAAFDELRHARLCFSIASAFAGVPLGPAAEALPVAMHTPTFDRVAHESIVDGCFGEGLAAEHARRRADSERDPALSAALECIASDEARHAELAWWVLGWCLTEAGDESCAALRRALGDLEARRPGAAGLAAASRDVMARVRDGLARA